MTEHRNFDSYVLCDPRAAQKLMIKRMMELVDVVKEEIPQRALRFFFMDEEMRKQAIEAAETELLWRNQTLTCRLFWPVP